MTDSEHMCQVVCCWWLICTVLINIEIDLTKQCTFLTHVVIAGSVWYKSIIDDSVLHYARVLDIAATGSWTVGKMTHVGGDGSWEIHMAQVTQMLRCVLRWKMVSGVHYTVYGVGLTNRVKYILLVIWRSKHAETFHLVIVFTYVVIL